MIDFVKIKKIAKHCKRIKRHATNWEKHLQITHPGKNLYPELLKYSQNSTAGKII